MKLFHAYGLFGYILLWMVIATSGVSSAYQEQIKNLSTAMAESIVTSGRKTIAVVDFTNLQGNVTELGRFVAEEFSVALAGAGKGFEVIDRVHLRTILSEHKLSATGLIDPKTARKLGQITGVEALITGTITPFGDSIRLSAKILDTATARVIGGYAGNIAKTRAIEELVSRGLGSEQQAFTTQPNFEGSPNAPGLQKKRFGDISVSVRNVLISRGQVLAMLNFFNQSDKELLLGISVNDVPSLIDENANVYKYRQATTKNWVTDVFTIVDKVSTLTPKSNNDLTLSFGYSEREVNLEDIGRNFALSFKYLVYSSRDKRSSSHNVSFAGIVAQHPRASK